MREWTNSWIEEGIEQGLHQGLNQGRHEGALRTVLRQLGRRVGLPGPDLQARLEALTSEALEDLAEALLDFTEPADLTAWLDAR